MRPHRSRLKNPRRTAESSPMHRGGTRLRGRVSALAVMVALGTSLLSGGATADAGGAVGSTGTITVGDLGTGVPGFAFVRPRASKPSNLRWSDMDPSDAWAKPAIDFVGATHSWMRDCAPNADGSYPFRPDMIETRKYFARTLVKAFAPDAVVDPRITFPDIDPTQSFYPWANIAVSKGWMTRLGDGRFMPDKPVTATTIHRALVLALGLRGTAKRLDRLSTIDGVRFGTARNFGTTNLGMRLGLRYPSSDAAHDVTPRSPLPRAQVAYSLYRAKTLATWVVPSLRDEYEGVALPRMGPRRLDIVRWGLKYIGYPYVYGGEWGFDSPPPSALGGQPIPGFDCSGIAWWLLRADDAGSWNISPPRPYQGWPLPQRSSADMARFGVLRYEALVPGDLAFYDGNGDGTVDHVDVFVGNGYALDSSTSVGGVTLMYVGPGSWYRQHFVHGRRLLPQA
jgi:cell wall-associated NlpC family hydrolase